MLWKAKSAAASSSARGAKAVPSGPSAKWAAALDAKQPPPSAAGRIPTAEPTNAPAAAPARSGNSLFSRARPLRVGRRQGSAGDGSADVLTPDQIQDMLEEATSRLGRLKEDLSSAREWVRTGGLRRKVSVLGRGP